MDAYSNDQRTHSDDEFSMSSYEGDHTDSLVIKPPQAVIQRREKREKREKKDKHRHKERHKSRHRSKEAKPGVQVIEEKRRERRRHREHDADGAVRHEGRRHEKHRDRTKRDRYPGELRSKERKMLERDQMERHRERPRIREEYMLPEQNRYDHRHEQMVGHPMRGHMPYHHRERLHGDDRMMLSHDNLIDLENLSPKEKSEREKRMERFMVAEHEPEMVELISDDDVLSLKDLSSEPDAPEVVTAQTVEASAEKKKKKKHKRDERIDTEPISSESAEESSDSESSSSSSEEEEEEEDEEEEREHEREHEREREEDKDRMIIEDHQRLKSVSPSGSSSESTSEEEKNERDSDTHSEAEYPKDSPMQSPSEIKEELPYYYPAIMGCRSVDEFECLNRIEEGTYGVVYRAREKTTNEIVALKRLKMEKEKEGFPITSLREVNTLLKGQHINIVTVREIVVGSNMDKIYIVMDYVEHDLKSLMETMRQKKQSFTIGEVKTLMIQLLRATHHLHDNWILHRDLKTSNLLLSHRGILKVGDFGLAREYGSPLKQYTPIVVTLWYRAPELLLGTKQYSCPIDVWSIGCIYGELLGMEPMFPGKSEIDQLNKIFKDLGTPSDKIWPGYSSMPVIRKTQFAEYPYNHLRERFKTRLSDEGFDIFNKFLTYDPSKRITCLEAMNHHYFTFEPPAPIDPAMFPTWPAKSENPYGRAKKAASPKPPSGGKNFKDLGDGEDENIAGFFLGHAPNAGPGFTLKF